MSALKNTKKYVSIITIVVIIGLLGYALNNLVFHYQLPFGNHTKSAINSDGPARIVRIEPIVLDCRARISAEVPVRGKKNHQVTVFGMTKTYRTDTVHLVATGDVETCVNGGADIRQVNGGGWRVVIPAKSVVFNRPRVDAVATTASVRTGKGWVGKLTDIFPWVSENNRLVPASYAFAQRVIGGSSCMEAAWQPTKNAVETAYRQQAKSKHVDPSKVSVTFSGQPDFAQNNGGLVLKGFTFATSGRVKCEVVPGATR